MESMACARIRLLAARGELAAAEETAGALCGVASERGLVRTALRGLALSMAVAEASGQPDRARERLVEFLRLAREADYVRPLVRDRDVSRDVLRRLLDTGVDPGTRAAAESMLARLGRDEPDSPAFSQRELQVLAEVRAGRKNREIAVRLGISQPGVRFHLRNVYRKTGLNRREEAVGHVQSLGLLD